ncbi:MAG TPA: flagellar filament capping protein FliD [Alphaproteobacteria bacterium]|nr:flagellar filament capping protein FliD [Alphaproteobacteria bacterium]
MAVTPLIRNESPVFNTEPGKPKVTMAPSIMGFNPADYIKSIKEVKDAEIRPKEDFVDTNTKRIAALKEFNALTNNFDEKCFALSNYMGVDTKATNLFQKMVARGAATDGTSLADHVEVTSSNNAESQKFKLAITQVASQDQRVTVAYSSATPPPLAVDGTLKINGTTITVTSSMLHSDLLEKINAVSDVTKAEASTFANTSSTNVLVLKSTDLASPLNFTGTDTAVFNALFGTTTVSNTDLDTLIAKGSFNGIDFTRTTNTVTDFIPNVTFQLQNATGVSIAGIIENDYLSLSQEFQGWIDAYNKLGDFIEKHHQFKEDGKTPTDDAILYKSTVLNTINDSLKSILSKPVKVDFNYDILTGSTTFTSLTNAAGLSGNLVVEGQTIAITSDMTGQEIITSVNSLTETTDVMMGVQTVTTSSGNAYALQLKGTIKNTPLNLSGSDASVLTAIGFSVGKDVITSKSTASFDNPTEVFGVSGNLVINGTSIALTSTMTRQDVQTAIDTVSPTTNVKQEFIEGTSSYITRLQGQVDALTIDLTGSDTTVLSALGYDTSGTLLSSRKEKLSVFDMFSNAGLSFKQRATHGYTMEIDQTKFQSMMIDNFDDFFHLFAATASTSNSSFNIYSTPKLVNSDVSLSDIEVNVSKASDNFVTATYTYKGQTYPAIYSNGLIQGVSSKVTSSMAISDLDAPASVTGNLKFAHKDPLEKQPINISLTPSLTWRQIRDNINAMSSYTDLYATVQTVNGSQYLTLMTAKKGGITFSSTDAATLDSLGMEAPTSAQNDQASLFLGLDVGYKNNTTLEAGANSSTTLNISQGIIDRAHKVLKDMLNEQMGVFKSEEKRFEAENKTLKNEIENLKKQMTLEIDRFNQSFNRLYESVSKYEEILKIGETIKELYKKES